MRGEDRQAGGGGDGGNGAIFNRNFVTCECHCQITVSYLQPLLSSKVKSLSALAVISHSGQERAEQLASRWNFCCNCELCSLPPEQLGENDVVRKEILELQREVEQWRAGSQHQSALQAAR